MLIYKSRIWTLIKVEKEEYNTGIIWEEVR